MTYTHIFALSALKQESSKGESQIRIRHLYWDIYLQVFKVSAYPMESYSAQPAESRKFDRQAAGNQVMATHGNSEWTFLL